MPPFPAADTIRILVATDNHVGYEERDPIRKDDSWKSFHEIMCLAKDQDVDMVLLAGDLFHDNKPSRKAMYQVMRSLRMNCLGEKPCELEMLSDASEVFEGAFNHVNYEDPDINVAIPVFSIHGNHDDPTGDGHYCSLDLLQMSGLLNYFGRTPESDNIQVKPILLQKGKTKLALYGMSNVRDERLFRTFRDGKVKFFKPSVQQSDWFNLMAVHQNHHAYTETGYLPENFLPEFMDLIVWGHEHECLIDPRYNPEMLFNIMQPGSSVATSLVPGEAVPKYVAILNVSGKEFKIEKIRIKSVRPFVTRELVLSEDKRFKALAKEKDNRTKLTRKLMDVVEELIEEAKAEWLAVQDDDDAQEEPPLPLVRLRVEYSAPDGGRYDCENPQRFSNRFVGKVANVNDVVQFYRKKSGQKKEKVEKEMPDEAIIASLAIDNVKVEKLVREFLTAQSLKILPQAPFGDAVTQFVDKDDKHAMEMFVNESLAGQVKQMLELDADDDEELENAMERYRNRVDEMFAAGTLKRTKKAARYKPRPENWDSDMDGEWEDQPGAIEISDAGEDETSAPPARRGRAATAGGSDDDASIISAAPPAKKAPAKRAPAKKAAAPKAPAKKATAKAPARGRKKVAEPSEDEDDDIIMIDDNPPPTRSQPSRTTRAPARGSRQTTLNFSQSQPKSMAKELSDDEISDDDAFEPMVQKGRRR
ncbi:DNA repair protein [Xylogone sp. PMI_703]|nr:DNA repair protein [Xylogone sp. PMI_703]